MRVNSIIRESIVDGPGIRYALFTQGCEHGCPRCHNPQTHDREGGVEIAMRDIIADLKNEANENPLLDGVTISGGEPLLQAGSLVRFADAALSMGLGIWLYTGFTIEEISSRGNPDELSLVERADVLVDGRFEFGKRTLESRFVGSTNQKIIERPKLYIHGPHKNPR
ncbi:MAG: anaerobic ribonucleoside-triphosphate reductase activating protein [Synergistaceae bacterium]|jgi:anaerobic ribonucleoside-triphosphate reductase activating protein|nr:anaerobic ribonucleoside-triphosphate reductase activating protein [Synergistaceae bacterium]